MVRADGSTMTRLNALTVQASETFTIRMNGGHDATRKTQSDGKRYVQEGTQRFNRRDTP